MVAVGLVLGSPFLLAAWVSWDAKRSIRILEKQVGSLDPKTFTRPSIPTASNGAQAFLAAGAALVLSQPSTLRLEPLPNGRCRLESLEIAELRRVFPPNVNAPQPTGEIVLPAGAH